MYNDSGTLSLGTIQVRPKFICIHFKVGYCQKYALVKYVFRFSFVSSVNEWACNNFNMKYYPKNIV